MSLTRQDIEATTIKFLSEEFEVDPSTITPEAPMKETLALDSLDYVDLVVAVSYTHLTLPTSDLV